MKAITKINPIISVYYCFVDYVVSGWGQSIHDMYTQCLGFKPSVRHKGILIVLSVLLILWHPSATWIMTSVYYRCVQLMISSNINHHKYILRQSEHDWFNPTITCYISLNKYIKLIALGYGDIYYDKTLHSLWWTIPLSIQFTFIMGANIKLLMINIVWMKEMCTQHGGACVKEGRCFQNMYTGKRASCYEG